LDIWSRGHEFSSQSYPYQVTILGKFFTPMCVWRCNWFSGWCW